MTARTLILSPRHLSGYRDYVQADSRQRGEHPIAVLPIAADRTYAVACGRWLEVSDKLVVYADFEIDEVAYDVIEEAESLSIEIEWRTLDTAPKPSWRERLLGALS